MKDSRNVIWGIVILAVAGGITFGSYFFAAPGGTYLVLFGAIIWGVWKILRGWGTASAPWRFIGSVAVLATAAAAVLVFQDFRDNTADFNAVEVGDCLDQDGREAVCDRAIYRVVFVRRYPDEISLPSNTRFETDSAACPDSTDYYFYPTPESWAAGDRSLVCTTQL